MKSARFRPQAVAEIEEAAAFYEGQRKGLGLDFLDEVDAVIQGIREYPERWPVYRRNTRRAITKRFPCLVFYRLEEDVILIVACIHPRRSPARWPR